MIYWWGKSKRKIWLNSNVPLVVEIKDSWSLGSKRSALSGRGQGRSHWLIPLIRDLLAETGVVVAVAIVVVVAQSVDAVVAGATARVVDVAVANRNAKACVVAQRDDRCDAPDHEGATPAVHNPLATFPFTSRSTIPLPLLESSIPVSRFTSAPFRRFSVPTLRFFSRNSFTHSTSQFPRLELRPIRIWKKNRK